jgi:PsbN protein
LLEDSEFFAKSKRLDILCENVWYLNANDLKAFWKAFRYWTINFFSNKAFFIEISIQLSKFLPMDSTAFFFTFFLWFLLLSATGYSVYVSFGPPSKKLRDPFEEHED